MWKCSQCEEPHDDLPLGYGAEAPAIYSQIPEKERRKRAVLDDERQIYVAIAMAETAVGDAADEVSADEPFAELRPIQRRERLGKLKRGGSGHLIFGIIVFSQHETPR